MRQGFTLIELLAVVLIIGILTAISLPQYRKSLDRAYVAEARQILPAVYDARERAKVERPCVTHVLPGSSEEFCTKVITFNKLDTEFKGSAGCDNTHTGNLYWKTGNFCYSLWGSFSGSEDLGDTNPPVSAQLLRGRWKGTTIDYDGDSFVRCTAPLDHPEACDFLDFQKED